jgi:predicted nucleic acid-binding protein
MKKRYSEEQIIGFQRESDAERIITGDRKHLLPIGTHQGIAIVTAPEVVDRLEAGFNT